MATCIVKANPLAYLAEQFYGGDTTAATALFDRKNNFEGQYLTNFKKIERAINDEVKRHGDKVNGKYVRLLIQESTFHDGKHFELNRGTNPNREYDGTQPLDQQKDALNSYYAVPQMEALLRSVVGSLKKRGVISPRVRFSFNRTKYKDNHGNPRIIVNMEKIEGTDPELSNKFNGKKTITVGKMLDNLINRDSTYAGLAQHLKDTVGKVTKLKISLADEKTMRQKVDKNLEFAPNGVFMQDENAIYIHKDGHWDFDEGKLDKVIMHEIMHMAITNANRTEEQVAALSAIYNRAKQLVLAKYDAKNLEDLKDAYAERWIGQRHITGKEFYGLENEDEFVAELFTNPVFMEEIASLDDPDAARQMSLWDRFVNWLADVLGLKGIKLKGVAFDAAKLVDDILRNGGGEINTNVYGRTSVTKPSNWDPMIWREMQQQILPYVDGMTDNEIQSRINMMEISPLMQNDLNDRVQTWDDFITQETEKYNIFLPEETKPETPDFYESLSEMGFKESESSTIRKYLTNDIADTFKTNHTPYKRNEDLARTMREKYPELVYENEVQRRFDEECRLTNQEMNELCEDIATTLMFEFDNLLEGGFARDILAMQHPTVFTKSILDEIDEIKTHPADRHYFDLAVLLGTDNIIHMIRHDMLNNPMCPKTLLDKLQIFSVGNNFGNDFMRYLMLKANPQFRERLGFTFNTEVKINDKTDKERYPLEGEKNSDIYNEAVVESVTEVENNNEDRIEEDQDTNNNDFIKEDSLTRSFLDNIDKPLRSALQRIAKNGRKSSFGRVQTYSWSEVANPLVRIVSKTSGSNSMMEAIEKSGLAFKNELLDILKNDQQLKSRLWSNFKLIETLYFSVDVKDVVIESDRTERMTELVRKIHGDEYFNPTDGLKTLATSGDERSMFEPVENITGKHSKTELIVRPNGVRKFHDAIKDLKIYDGDTKFQEPTLQVVSSILDDNTVNNILYGIESLGFIGKMDKYGLRMWMSDIHPVNMTDGSQRRLLDLNNYNKIVNLLRDIYTSITGNYYTKSDLSDIERTRQVSKRLDFIKALNEISNIIISISGSPVERMVRNHGNDYSSFVKSNYIGRIFDQLQWSSNGLWNNARDLIANEYANSPFFKYIFERDAQRGIRPRSWLTEIFYNPAADTRLMRISTLSTYNGKKFQEMSPLEQMTMKLMLFTWDKTGVLADYIVPVMSDKSRTCAITNRKLNAIQIRDNLYQVVMQELDRMSMLVQRAKGNIPSSYEATGYDIKVDGNGNAELGKNGMRFVFMPIFNETLSKINDDNACRNDKLVAWMHDMVYRDGKYNDTYQIHEVDKAVNTNIDQSMAIEFEALYSSLRDAGALKELEANLHVDSQALKLILQSYSINSFFAETQIYQILTGDLAMYKSKDEIIKRFAEVISDGMEQDPDALLRGDERVYSHADDKEYPGQPTSKTYIMLDDMIGEFRNYDSFMKIHAKRRDHDIAIVKKKFSGEKNKEKREDLIRRINYLYRVKGDIYKKIDRTDGQGWLSFKGYDSMMHALGRGADIDAIWNEYSKFYDRFAELFSDDISYEEHSRRQNEAEHKKWINDFWQLHNDVHKFNEKNRDKLHFEVVKQMTYSQIDRDGIKTPTYIKNSECPLMDIERMMDEATSIIGPDGTVYRQGDSSMAKIASFMHRNDIDAAIFKSNVKVGAMQVMKYDTKTLTNDLQKAALGNNERGNWVFRVPVRDVMLQQETTDHTLDHERPEGAQLKNFSFGAVNPDSMIDDDVIYETGRVISGNKRSAESMRIEMEDLRSKRMQRYCNELIEKYGLADDLLTRNVKLRSAIFSYLAASGENNYDNQYRFSINDNGEFNIPLSEPNSQKVIDRMFTSAVKRAALEVNMPGGQLVQVSDGFRFDSSKVSAQADKSLRIAYKRADGTITYDVGEAVAIAYFEAEMPYYYKDMYKLGDELDERLSRLVMYRIPTEGSCSVFPVKVIKWSNRISGGIVKLPAEIPGIGGMDYDIDKLFFIAPSVNVVKEKYRNPATGKIKDGKVIAIDYVTRDYAKKVQGNDDKADCNRILEIYWNILTSPENMQAMFIPSNFKDLEHNKNVFGVMAPYIYADEATKLEAYNRYQAADDDVIANEIPHNSKLSVCGPAYQLDKSIINSIAKRLLGIFANANSQHVYMQGRGLRLLMENVSGKNSINDNNIENRIEFDPVLANDGFTKVYENVTQFLTASADAVKNPTLHELGINEFTVNAVVAMLRSGFDIETICLVMQQPVVRMLVNDYDLACAKNADGRPANIMKIIRKGVARLANIKAKGPAWGEMVNKTLRVSNVRITKQDLLKHFGKSLQGDNWRNAQMKNDQLTILKLIYGFFSAKQTLLDSNRILKIDIASSRHGSDMTEYIGHLDSIRDYIDSDHNKIINLPDLEHGEVNPAMKRLYTSYDLQQYMFDEICKAFDPRYREVLAELANSSHFGFGMNPKPNAKWFDLRTKNMYEDWNWFNFVNDQTGTNRFSFGMESPKGYIPWNEKLATYFDTKFLNDVAKTKMKLFESGYADNEFLKHLIIDKYGVKLPKKSIAKGDDTKIGDSFSDLFNSEDKAISNFARALIIYDWYKNGFKNSNNTFWSYLPARDMARLENVMSFWRKVSMGMTHDNIDNFILVFLLNHPEYANNTIIAAIQNYMTDYANSHYFDEEGSLEMGWTLKPACLDFNIENVNGIRDKIGKLNTPYSAFDDYTTENVEDFLPDNSNSDIINNEYPIAKLDFDSMTDEEIKYQVENPDPGFAISYEDACEVNPELKTNVEAMRKFLKEFYKLC